MERWAGKVAVVTGASSGIGEATVRDLVSRGIKVAALARRADRLQALEKELSGKGEVKGIPCDVTKEEDMVKAFKWIEDNWGGVSIMINNAGYLYMSNTFDVDITRLNNMFGTNVVGLMTGMKEALKSMKAHGIDDGHIINVNSIAGHQMTNYEYLGPYSATKHAVTVLTEFARREMGTANKSIKVTSLSPGLVETEMTAEFLVHATKPPCLKSSAISNAIIYVLSTPPDVNISELTIQPVKEQSLIKFNP